MTARNDAINGFHCRGTGGRPGFGYKAPGFGYKARKLGRRCTRTATDQSLDSALPYLKELARSTPKFFGASQLSHCSGCHIAPPLGIGFYIGSSRPKKRNDYDESYCSKLGGGRATLCDLYHPCVTPSKWER